MSTSSQIEANRRNALKSTGPKTAEGKQRVSQNAVKHGVFCRHLVLASESQEEFDAFSSAMLRRLNPRDILELQFVERIISAHWRLKRLRAAEAELYHIQQENVARRNELLVKRFHPDYRHRSGVAAPPIPTGVLMATMFEESRDPVLERLHRYERQLENTVDRCLRDLRKLREEEQADEPTDFTQSVLKSKEPAPLPSAGEPGEAENEDVPGEGENGEIEMRKTNPNRAEGVLQHGNAAGARPSAARGVAAVEESPPRTIIPA